jgi:hypothetical protein
MPRYPNLFLFGTDGAAPTEQASYERVFQPYEALWKIVGPANFPESPLGKLPADFR